MKQMLWGLLLFALQVRAAQYELAVRPETEHLFVGETIEIVVELRIPQGESVEQVQALKMPSAEEGFESGEWQMESPSSAGGKTCVRWHVPVRACRAGTREFSPEMRFLSVSGRGFFFRHMTNRRATAPAFKLTVDPLPAAPARFSGIVDDVTLVGSISTNEVHVGDILTAEVRLRTEHPLPEGLTPLPQAETNASFKVYPPRATRTAEGVTLSQVWVLTAAAESVPAYTLVYFNPQAKCYQTAQVGPFPLKVLEGQASTEVEAVDLTAALSAAPAPRPAAVDVAKSLREIRLFADEAVEHLDHAAEAKFAPAESAKTLFSIPAGGEITPLESSGAWRRVRFGDRSGWIR